MTEEPWDEKQASVQEIRERVQKLYRESAKYVPCQNHAADEYYRIMAEIIRLEKLIAENA